MARVRTARSLRVAGMALVTLGAPHVAAGAPAQATPAQEAPAQEVPTTGTAAAEEDPAKELAALLRRLPRRTRLGAARSVRVRSTVTFRGLPDRPHGLTVDYAFPGRTRFELFNGQGGRRERYQLDAALFAREVRPSRTPEERASRRLEGREALEVTLDLAARRALFCWPDGRTWVPSGEDTGEVAVDLPGVGRLVATAPANGDQGPASVRALRPDGGVASRLTATAWSEVEGRPWPSRVQLTNAVGDLVWTETVDAVEPSWFLGDLWFAPKDRVSALAGKAGAGRLRLRAHGTAWVKRMPLPRADGGGRGAEAIALERWTVLRKQLQNDGASDAPRLARVVSVVLGEGGVPVALEFECSGATEPAPESAGEDGSRWGRRGPRLVWHDLRQPPLGRDAVPSGEDIERLGEAARRTAAAQGTRAAGELVLRLTVDAGPDPGGVPRVLARVLTAPLAAPDRPGDGDR